MKHTHWFISQIQINHIGRGQEVNVKQINPVENAIHMEVHSPLIQIKIKHIRIGAIIVYIYRFLSSLQQKTKKLHMGY